MEAYNTLMTEWESHSIKHKGNHLHLVKNTALLSWGWVAQQHKGGDWPTYGLISLCWDQSWTGKIMAYNGWSCKVKILNTEIHTESFVLLWITCSRLKLVTKVHISLTRSASNTLMLSCEFCIQTYYITVWATDCTDMVQHLELNLHERTHTHTHTDFNTFVVTIRYC